MERLNQLILRVLLTAAAIVAIGCGSGDQTGAMQSYLLEEIRRYGVPELGPDTMALPEVERRAGGAVLGSIRGMVQGPDSTLYVLERDWSKIVAFRPDGSLKSVLLGGAGEGPGEFRLPIDIALTPDGRLAVLDYELQRVSLFDPAEGYISSFRVGVPGPLRLAATTDRIWISRSVGAGGSGARAVAFDYAGRELEAGPPLAEEDRPYGSTANLIALEDGVLMLPSARPGIWEVMRNGSVERRGIELVPGLKPPKVWREGMMTNVGMAEAVTFVTAPLEGRHVLVWYITGENDANERWKIDTIRQQAAVLSLEGELLGNATLPPGLEPAGSAYFHVSPLTGHLFISVSDPYPAVVELRLVQRG
jgi:hypothetical protein